MKTPRELMQWWSVFAALAVLVLFAVPTPVGAQGVCSASGFPAAGGFYGFFGDIAPGEPPPWGSGGPPIGGGGSGGGPIAPCELCYLCEIPDPEPQDPDKPDHSKPEPTPDKVLLGIVLAAAAPPDCPNSPTTFDCTGAANECKVRDNDCDGCADPWDSDDDNDGKPDDGEDANGDGDFDDPGDTPPDQDDDGDGIPDERDPDHPDYNPNPPTGPEQGPSEEAPGGEPDPPLPEFGDKEGDPVALAQGEFQHSVFDVRIPGRGFDFELQRTYRNRVTNFTVLGYNWDHNYNSRLFRGVVNEGDPNDPTDDSFSLGSGSDIGWAVGNSRFLLFKSAGNGIDFISPKGFFGKLRRNPSGTYTVRMPDGMLHHFCAFSPGDYVSFLTAMVDRSGNSMGFHYDTTARLVRVVDTLGRDIDFGYSSVHGRLASVTDFTGRQVLYGYDEAGDLEWVTYPKTEFVLDEDARRIDSGHRVIHYDYSTELYKVSNDLRLRHNLTAIRDAKGHTFLTIQYGTKKLANGDDGDDYDRVILQGFGEGVFQYGYLEISPPTTDATIPQRMTTFMDRKGFVEERFYNSYGMLLARVEYTANVRGGVDPGSYTSVFSYDDENRLLAENRMDGSATTYLYDSSNPVRFAQGNLLRTTRTPGPAGGDQTQLVSEFTYDPAFQRVATRKDESNRVVAHFFDYQEGNAASNGMNTMATTWGLDLSGVAFGLGDLNGDTRSDQAQGNVVTTFFPNATGYDAAGNTVTQTGLRTTMQWNDQGQMVLRVNPEGEATQWNYETDAASHEFGYLKSTVQDPNGLKIRRDYELDPLGNTTAVIDGRGVRNEFTFDALDRLTQIKLAAGVPDGDDDLVAHGYLKRVWYDRNGNLAREEVENRGADSAADNPWYTTEYFYDKHDRRIKIEREIDPVEKAVTQYQYDLNDNRTLILFPEGNTDSFLYDERDLVWEITRGSSDPAQAGTYRAFYNDVGSMVRFEDPEDTDGDGQVEAMLFEYDGYGRKKREIDPVGGERLYAYSPTGEVTSLTERGTVGGPSPQGNDTSGNVDLRRELRDYDELDRLIRKRADLFIATASGEQPLQTGDGDTVSTAIWIYDRSGRLTTLVNDNGHAFGTEWDAAGRVTRVNLPDGSHADYGYDQAGNRISAVETDVSTDGARKSTFSTKFAYDALNRLIRSEDQTGRTRRVTVDSRGFPVRYTDANGPVSGAGNLDGNVSRTLYDGLGRIVEYRGELRVGGDGGKPIDPTQGGGDGLITTFYDWDRNGRLKEVRDDNGNSTTYDYDPLDRRIRETFADQTFRQWDYDKDSNVRQITEPNGSLITQTRDGLNRIVRTAVSRGAGVAGTTLQTFQWDGLHRKTLLFDNNDPGNAGDDVFTRFSYNSMSKVTQDGSYISSLLPVWLDTFSAYDGAGHLAQVAYPSGLKGLDYTNDELGRIVSIRDAGQQVAGYSYLGQDRVESRSTADGVNLAVGYDAARRVTSFQAGKTQPDDVVGYSYTWDRESNRTAVARAHQNGLGDTFEYDSAYRLVQHLRGASNPLTTPSGGTLWQWQLDGVGNWDSLQVQGQAPITTAVNSTNEYDRFGAASLSHDASGNVTSDGSLTYVYDFRNRVLSASSGGQRVGSYTYDALNRRVTRTLYSGGTANNTVSYLYRGPDVIAEVEAPNGNLALSALYIHGQGVDEVVAVDRDFTLGDGAWNPIRLFHHTNALGSVTALTDVNGTPVERYSYTAYGKVTITDGQGNPRTSSLAKNSYMFTGRRFDPETENYFYRSRYYSTELGRFLQRDRLGYNAGSMGLHEYVGGNPINLVDPDGEFIRALVGAAIGAVVGVVVETVKQIASGEGLDGTKILASGAGGAVEGAILASTGQATLASAAGAAVENGLNVVLDGKSLEEAAFDTAASVGLGKLGGKFTPPASKAPLKPKFANRIREIKKFEHITRDKELKSIKRFARNRAYSGGAGIVTGTAYGYGKNGVKSLLGEKDPPLPDLDSQGNQQTDPGQGKPQEPVQGPKDPGPSAPDNGRHGGPDGGSPSKTDPNDPPSTDPKPPGTGSGDSDKAPPETNTDPAGETPGSENGPKGDKG